MRSAIAFDTFEQGITGKRSFLEGDYGATGHVCRECRDARRAMHQRGSRQLSSHPSGRSDVTDGFEELWNRLWHRSLEPGVGRLHGLDDISVGPHDALGVPGRSAGEEHPYILGRTFDPGGRLTLRDQVVIARSPLGCRIAPDLNEHAKLRKVTTDFIDRIRQRMVEEERLCVGVLEQRMEFFRRVSKIDVEGGESLFEAGELNLGVRNPIVEGEPDIGSEWQVGCCERGRDARGLILVFSPATTGVSANEGIRIGDLVRDRLPGSR